MKIIITNATPHTTHVLCDVFADDRIIARLADGTLRPAEIVHTTDGPAYEFEPSGFRLAAEAHMSGPKVGGAVRYRPTETAKSELRQLEELDRVENAFVICSEISVRALCPAYARTARLVYPVLAAASLRKPPAQRWASSLATAQRPILNLEGECVGTRPYWER